MSLETDDDDQSANFDKYGEDITEQHKPLFNSEIPSNEARPNELKQVETKQDDKPISIQKIKSNLSENLNNWNTSKPYKKLYQTAVDFATPMDLLEDLKRKKDDVGYESDGIRRFAPISQTEQEKENEEFPNDHKSRYWTPKNIMNIEDAPYSNRLVIILLMLSFSYFGNLARISFQSLLTYQNAYIYYNPGTLIWINFTSCVIAGFADSAYDFWDAMSQGSNRHLNLKQIPLHTGITAGFCGCFSTYSGVISELVFVTINGSLPVPNNGYGVMQFFAVLITQFGLCFFGIYLGGDLAYGFDYFFVPYIKPYVSIRTCRFLEFFIIILGIVATIINIVLSAVLDYDNTYKKRYSIACLFGVFGCHLRYKLMELNGKIISKWFPTGTYIVNVSACIILAVLNLLLYGYSDKENKARLITNPVYICIIKAFANGFCGSLSTFAAMVTEMVNMGNPKYRYTYFSIMFISCFIPVLLILGCYYWTKGMAPV